MGVALLTCTIIIGRMGHWTAKPHTSGWSQKPEPKRYRRVRTLHSKGWLAALDDFRNWLRLGLQPAKGNEARP